MNNEYRYFKYSTSSSSIKLEKGGNYIFSKIEGLTESEVDLSLLNFSDYAGAKYTGYKQQSREIVVEGHIVGLRANHNILRRDLIDCFNPTSELGTIEIKMWDGKVYTIDAICTNLVIKDESVVRNVKEFQATFFCPSPFFKGEKQSYCFSEREAKFEFPFEVNIDSDNSLVFGEFGGNNQKQICNNGNVDTPFVISIYGESVAPIMLINETTGDFIEIDTDIKEDEIIEISTYHSNKYCIKKTAFGEQNVFEYMNFNSKFFNLKKGINKLKFLTGDAEAEGNTIQLEFFNLYNGI